MPDRGIQVRLRELPTPAANELRRLRRQHRAIAALLRAIARAHDSGVDPTLTAELQCPDCPLRARTTTEAA